jgi:lysophospholipase L1-like esterase
MIGLACCVATIAAAGPERWEKAIKAFEERDRASAPKKGSILFIGSSSIRMWKTNKWFPDKGIINRGFGGSQIEDSIHFADRIVFPYAPKTIVLYAGDNDVAAGKTAMTVYEDYVKFVIRVQARLPDAQIVFIAIKPSISRWKLAPEMDKANRLIAEHAEETRNLSYANIWTPMLGEDGKPRKELFAKDGLHLNDAGYKLWTEVVGEHLEQGTDN